ncbi:Ltp family lipoprotein [Pseudonocardia bannensis]|uniref:Ltp family lipoprotein n=1 Tax=Pseudonocardia bannensis TaxID=630973 RepID=UPI001B7D0A78|nr:Ltp family lipoprotein [Pseudonocardia bannensis]
MLIGVVAAAAGANDGRTESPTAAAPTYAPTVIPPTPIAAPSPAAVPAPNNTASAPESFTAAPSEPTTPTLSVSRQNAVESAESYLSFSAFSRQGLIDQLKYEGFTAAQAKHGADSVGL